MDEVVFECFGPEVKKVKGDEIESLLKQNLLVNFFVPFCRAGLGLIFLTMRDGDKPQGFSFNELFKRLEGIYSGVSPQLLRKYLERALDILLDIGLFSAKWGQKGNYWQRLFYNRSEVAKRLRDYRHYIKPFLDSVKTVQLFELLLLGPDKDPNFFLKVLDINSYLAHTGDIIDPDHWHINLKCEFSISYSTLWSILEGISQNRIYDANIKFHHERKKITIYDLNNGIEGALKNIKEKKGLDLEITQCKIRFLLNPEKAPEREDGEFKIKQFLIVPIVNIRFKGQKKSEEEDYPSEIDDITSTLVENLTISFFERLKQQLNVDKGKFSINAKCNLLEIKNKDEYQNKKKEFEKKLSRYGVWNEDLDVGLKHLECWESFVPKVIRKKAKEIERDLQNCIVKQCSSIEPKPNMLLLTLARKGDVLVKHLYEVFKEERTFVEILNKFDKNYINSEFHSISEMEFFIKARQHKDKISTLVIFDDAIDKGKKLETVLDKIRKMRKEGKLEIEDISVIAFVGNKKNSEALKEKLGEQGVNISVCNQV
ncbi:MAG: hypothetical protein DRP41_04380 [Thermodesulfobacteriota bacterium]|nr:MAG: hypothetical protein DRP41_04380 [Thermodesulfobacteriota bacterium]